MTALRVCGLYLNGADPAWHRDYRAARFRVSHLGEHEFEGGASIGPIALTPVTAETAEDCAWELTLRVRDFARTIAALAE